MIKIINKFINLISKINSFFIYYHVLKNSIYFCKNFYRAERTELIAKVFPLIHYILIGERRLYRPSKEFNPYTYIDLNSDVVSFDSGRVLKHFLNHGESERRQFRHPQANNSKFMPLVHKSYLKIYERRFRNLNKKIMHQGEKELFHRCGKHDSQIIFIYHIFYIDIFEKNISKFNNLNYDYTLIITCNSEEIGNKIKNLMPKNIPYEIWLFKNIGKDILPFMQMTKSLLSKDFKYACKLHTKKSPHLINGSIWEESLSNSLISNPLIEFMLENDVSILGDDRFLYKENDVETLSNVSNFFNEESICNLSFFGGSMFWISKKSINILSLLPFDRLNFIQDNNLMIEYASEHSLERVISFNELYSDNYYIQKEINKINYAILK